MRYITKGIRKDLLGWPKISSCPDGHWNKGGLTTSLLEFLNSFCQEHQLEQSSDERTRLIASAARAINTFMRGLYTSGFWLEQSEKNLLVKSGDHFLKAGARLALLSFESGEDRFAITPKHHLLYHIVKVMQWQYDMASFAMNAVTESCHQDEDFVGRLARICRSVSPRATCIRTVQRYLLQVREAWFQP